MNFYLERLSTPIGEMLIVTDPEGRLRALDFGDYEPRMRRLLRLHYGEAVALGAAPSPSAASEAVLRYLSGDFGALDQIEVATGGTAFQREVWAALRRIPISQTTTYARLAAQIGRPNAVRAVGLANGSNPVAIVVPCHRVIGAGGALTGYAGGLERKAWLLRHEGALAS